MKNEKMKKNGATFTSHSVKKNIQITISNYYKLTNNHLTT